MRMFHSPRDQRDAPHRCRRLLCVLHRHVCSLPGFLKHNVAIEDKGTRNLHQHNHKQETIGNNLKHLTTVRHAKFDRKHRFTILSSAHSVTQQALNDRLAHDLDFTRKSQSATSHLALSLLVAFSQQEHQKLTHTHTPESIVQHCSHKDKRIQEHIFNTTVCVKRLMLTLSNELQRMSVQLHERLCACSC